VTGDPFVADPGCWLTTLDRQNLSDTPTRAASPGSDDR
jgi:hypothetical protein